MRGDSTRAPHLSRSGCPGFPINLRAQGQRVEAPFQRIEKGFLVGGKFTDWTDLNSQARATCEQWNAKYSTKLHASRRELFAAEQAYLKPLPLHVPEVYQLCTRIVDARATST